jgi:hypothetical protein
LQFDGRDVDPDGDGGGFGVGLGVEKKGKMWEGITVDNRLVTIYEQVNRAELRK